MPTPMALMSLRRRCVYQQFGVSHRQLEDGTFVVNRYDMKFDNARQQRNVSGRRSKRAERRVPDSVAVDNANAQIM